MEISLSVLEESIYKNYKSITNFNKISKIRINFLLNLVNNYKINYLSEDAKTNYARIIYYLSRPKCRVVSKEYCDKYNLMFQNYEEIYFFLINTLDPNCEIYKYYLQNYNKNIQQEIQKKYGFYNKQFMYLEKKYISSILNNFIFNIKKDYSDMLILLTSCSVDFNKIDNNRMRELNDLSTIYNNIQTDNNNEEKINSCIFNVIAQKDFLELLNDGEILMFIIFCIDPEFKLAQIYENECNYKSMEKCCKKEVGTFNRKLIDIEKEIIEKYNFNINLNMWDEKKYTK